MSLPPSSSKGDTESNFVTTFNTDYDKIPVTRVGVTAKIGTIPVSQGGTGSTTQNFVDLTTNQTIAGNKILSGRTILGDSAIESTGIDVNGTTYESTFKVYDIAGTNSAQTVLHKHSTALEPLILGARSNDNTTAHTDVTAGQRLLSILSAGVAGLNYKIFASINMVASTLGSISNTSSPGKVIINTTPNGGVSATPHLTMDSDKSSAFAGTVSATQVVSTIATGTAPLVVASTTKVTNLYTDRASLADAVTTNANLTGDITSVGNATTYNATVPVNKGGTGATTAPLARQSLSAQPVFNGLEDPSRCTALSYVGSTTRALTVTWTAPSYVTVGGARFLVATETATIHADTTGLWFFYYDAAGILQKSQSPWDLLTTAPLCAVYYNAVTKLGIILNELHPGISGMDDATHKNLHITRGTQIVSGFGIPTASYALNTNSLAAITPSVNLGVLADEDLILNSAAVVDGGPYRNIWKTGTPAAPIWNWSDSFTTPFWNDATQIGYNQNNAGTFQMTAIAANVWVNYWVLATTSYSSPQIVFVAGENTYGSLALAQAATFSSDVSGVSSFTTEGVVLNRLTFRRAGGGAANFNCQLQDVASIVQSITVSASAVAVPSVTVVTPATTYAILSTDGVVLGDCTSAGFTATLPTAVGISGTIIRVKKIDATINALTIATTSSQTIDGETSIIISTPYQGYTFVSNGLNWSILS